MSGNKKSPGLLILFILFLLGAAYLLWSLYGPGGKSEMPNVAEQMSQQDDNAAQSDADNHAGHDHGTSNAGQIMANTGEVGTVTELPVNDILGVRGIGNPNAPVQVREYFSLTCNHCADFHQNAFKQLKSKYIDTGKVYFIYEEMPLNGPALYGSMIARCLPEERYAGFVSLLLETQQDWAFGGDFKTALQQNAALNGMNEDEFNECFQNEELRMAIAANIDASAQAWEIRSTPTFVFNNGERILRGGQSIESFDAVYQVLTNKDAAAAVEESSPFEMEKFDSATDTPSSTGVSITTPVNEAAEFEPNGEVVTPTQNIE